MGEEEMGSLSGLIDIVLKAVEITGNTEYRIEKSISNDVKDKVKELCRKFPIC